MRRRRIYGDAHNRSNIYHAMSRAIEGRFVLEGREEKAKMRELVFAQAAFSGVEVLTYCIMSNHFHLLLRVAHRDAEKLAAMSEEEMLARLSHIYEGDAMDAVREELASARRMDADAEERRRGTEGDDHGSYHRACRERYETRMLDLSVYMREVKQKFSQWYSRRVVRKGPLWEDRFKSVLVEALEERREGAGALQMMAAYIDLNPVRAGLVADPKNYRWSGYGEAVAGVDGSREGIAKVVGEPRASRPKDRLVGNRWREVASRYRLLLYETGADGEAVGEELAKVRDEGGELSALALLGNRIRYFSDALARKSHTAELALTLQPIFADTSSIRLHFFHCKLRLSSPFSTEFHFPFSPLPP